MPRRRRRRRRQRRRRKNPDDTLMVVLLGGAVAAGAYFLFFRPRATVAAVLPDPAKAMVGTMGPPNSGTQPVAAGAAGYILKRDPSGSPMCFTVEGKKAALSKCAHLRPGLDLEGFGSLAHYGRGSLGA